jgi:hypothetical protein
MTQVGHRWSNDGPGAIPDALPPAAPADVERATAAAAANFDAVVSHWATALGRDGIDGRGGRPQLSIEPDLVNAIADSKRGVLRLGRWAPDKWFADDLSTISHEYTHFVLFTETDGTSRGLAKRWQRESERHSKLALDAGGKRKFALAAKHRKLADTFHMKSGQYLAIHEGIADIMGAAFTQRWGTPSRDSVTGAGIISDYRLYVQMPAWSDDPKLTAREPHVASGIVSNAAVDIQQALGWEATERIFYEVIRDDRMTDAALFSDVATIAVDHAGRRYGPDAAAVVRQAFADNHVPVR